MDFFCSWHILPAAFLLDIILGDPRSLYHPIWWMGKAVSTAEPYFRRLSFSLLVSGAFFSIFLITGTWAITLILVKTAGLIHPLFRTIIEITLIYYTISAQSLEKSALHVLEPLLQNRIFDAKKNVSLIVGRDVEKLSEQGIAQATVETVAENLVDGVISPLFFAAIGGAPLAMAYKMVNTLDSMVGYKNEKYIYFGKFSAKIDDIANYIPARISVPIISFAAQILFKKGITAFKTAVLQGLNHSSPNAGYPEASFAGALSVKLGGPNYYHDIYVDKPYIGVQFAPVNNNDIKKACDLMLLASFIALILLLITSIILSVVITGLSHVPFS